MGVDFKDGQPATWKETYLSDPMDCLRLKLLDMLGSEGPRTLDKLAERLPFQEARLNRYCKNWR